MKNILTLVFIVAISFSVVACDGDDGIAGLTGPSGDDGIAGLTGPSGDDGSDGETGSSGDQGNPGEQGPPGETGLTGEIQFPPNFEEILASLTDDQIMQTFPNEVIDFEHVSALRAGLNFHNIFGDSVNGFLTEGNIGSRCEVDFAYQLSSVVGVVAFCD